MATAPRAVPKAVPKAEMPPEEPPVAKKKKSKLKLIAVVLIIVLAIGGAAAFFTGGKKSKPSADEARHEAVKPPVFIVMEPFTVNLQQEAADQFLQISMTVQVGDEKQVEEIKLYMPQVRSRVLLLLSGKKASDINTAEGKKKLADDITAQIRLPFIPGGKPQEVSNVYFTSFVIQ